MSHPAPRGRTSPRGAETCPALWRECPLWVDHRGDSRGLWHILEILSGVIDSVPAVPGSQSSIFGCTFSLIFLRHIFWRVTGGAPNSPESRRVTLGRAFCPPSAVHPAALADQMIQQMFRFVVIAFKTVFREINCRLKYFKEYHISFLFFILTISLLFLWVFFPPFGCVIKNRFFPPLALS